MSLVLALLLQAATAAGPGSTICAKVADPPAGMEAWSKPSAALPLKPGTALTLPMDDVANLRFPVAPARAPVGGTYGAVQPFTVTTAGIYAIALSEAAWVDVTGDGRVLTAIGHRHGPPCSGIRKIVDFRLAPGTYTLQLIGAPRPEGTALIVRR